MIGWLKGQKIDIWEQALKQGIILACSGIGYEIHLLSRHKALVESDGIVKVWIHQITREDGDYLYGFEEKGERDLFRLLISVSGIGPQIAMALLEEIEINQLIDAIVNKDLKTLTQAQGIGKRTAERLSIELRHKLERFDSAQEIKASNVIADKRLPPFTNSDIAEITQTLEELGYEEVEIEQALMASIGDYQVNKKQEAATGETTREEIETFLKACLIWLSKESGK